MFSPPRPSIPVLALATLLGCKSADSGMRSDASRDAQSSVATPSAVGVASAAADTAGLLARADRSRIQGDSAAPVWIVVVSDFQCPYCKVWHDQTYPTLVQEYVRTGKVRMAYVHLPLQMHQHALPAAEASMCAGAQGKFWEMHDAIFATQEQWSALPSARATFDSLAMRVGVGNAGYRDCVQRGHTRSLVQADNDRVTRSGVQSTPNFFIGDEVLSGAQPLEAFRAAIARALAKSGGARP